jgi:hypothetical protein
MTPAGTTAVTVEAQGWVATAVIDAGNVTAAEGEGDSGQSKGRKYRAAHGFALRLSSCSGFTVFPFFSSSSGATDLDGNAQSIKLGTCCRLHEPQSLPGKGMPVH